ncbi:MAG: signal peptidase II [Spirochaetota bacterium]
MVTSRQKALPFIATALVIFLDQLTKFLVVDHIAHYAVAWSSGPGELLRIIHVRNRAVAFSLGDTLPDAARLILFIVVPLLIIVGVIVYMCRSDEFSSFQRWAIALMIGGGIGNLIDRIFRPGGVVDFIDVKFFGIFGLERWPTFNVADSSVVVGGILLVLSLLGSKKEERIL